MLAPPELGDADLLGAGRDLEGPQALGALVDADLAVGARGAGVDADPQDRCPSLADLLPGRLRGRARGHPCDGEAGGGEAARGVGRAGRGHPQREVAPEVGERDDVRRLGGARDRPAVAQPLVAERGRLAGAPGAGRGGEGLAQGGRAAHAGLEGGDDGVAHGGGERVAVDRGAGPALLGAGHGHADRSTQVGGCQQVARGAGAGDRCTVAQPLVGLLDVVGVPGRVGDGECLPDLGGARECGLRARTELLGRGRGDGQVVGQHADQGQPDEHAGDLGVDGGAGLGEGGHEGLAGRARDRHVVREPLVARGDARQAPHGVQHLQQRPDAGDAGQPRRLGRLERIGGLRATATAAPAVGGEDPDDVGERVDGQQAEHPAGHHGLQVAAHVVGGRQVGAAGGAGDRDAVAQPLHRLGDGEQAQHVREVPGRALQVEQGAGGGDAVEVSQDACWVEDLQHAAEACLGGVAGRGSGGGDRRGCGGGRRAGQAAAGGDDGGRQGRGQCGAEGASGSVHVGSLPMVVTAPRAPDRSRRCPGQGKAP